MKEFNFETTPIVDIVNRIIIDAVMQNASDIHFDPAENYLRIRIRIDGDLQDYSIVPNKYKRNLITRVKLLAGMNITESRLPQDGAIKSTIKGKDLDLRVSSLPTSFGEKVVVRILDYSMSLNGIEALGFTEENYQKIMRMLNDPNGIILVTGATGSGKSTTVYSMLQKLNREEVNIITVEDPVEMNIEGLNQIQVNAEIGLDFANVLRSILRQDPNIILIGEIRDSETAKIAIRASITGHLVLSTLHTNNSLTTIERLLDMDVERYLLSSSLQGIISQNLAKKLCKRCAVKRPTTDMEKRIFKKALNLDVEEVYSPGHCKYCHNGYKGRIALQEVLEINDEIRNAINDSVPREELRKLIYKKGVKTLLQDGLLKVLEGITTMEEVFRLVEVENDPINIYGKDETENNTETTKNDIKIHLEQKEEDEIAPNDIKEQDINISPKKEENKTEKTYPEFQNRLRMSRLGRTPTSNEENNLENTQDIFNAIMQEKNKEAAAKQPVTPQATLNNINVNTNMHNTNINSNNLNNPSNKTDNNAPTNRNPFPFVSESNHLEPQTNTFERPVLDNRNINDKAKEIKENNRLQSNETNYLEQAKRNMDAMSNTVKPTENKRASYTDDLINLINEDLMK